jgi:hypothetical protein
MTSLDSFDSREPAMTPALGRIVGPREKHEVIAIGQERRPEVSSERFLRGRQRIRLAAFGGNPAEALGRAEQNDVTPRAPRTAGESFDGSYLLRRAALGIHALQSAVAHEGDRRAVGRPERLFRIFGRERRAGMRRRLTGGRMNNAGVSLVFGRRTSAIILPSGDTEMFVALTPNADTRN